MNTKFQVGEIVEMCPGFSVNPWDENYAGSGWSNPDHPDFKGLEFKIIDTEFSHYWAQPIYRLIALEYDGEFNKEWNSVVEFGLRLTKQGNRNKVLEGLGI